MLSSRLAVSAAGRNPDDRGRLLFKIFCEWYRFLEPDIKRHIRYVLAGGSLAKGTSDRSSDIDAMLMIDEIADRSFYTFFEKHRTLVQEDGGHIRLDLRILPVSDVQRKVDGFAEARDVSIALQDFLWNVRFGLYIEDRPEWLVEKIARGYDRDFSPVVCAVIYRRFDSMIVNLRDSILHLGRDYLQVTEMRLRLMKLSLLHSFQELGEGFWGYKNTHLILPDLPLVFREIFESCMSYDDSDPRTPGELARLSRRLLPAADPEVRKIGQLYR